MKLSSLALRSFSGACFAPVLAFTVVFSALSVASAAQLAKVKPPASVNAPASAPPASGPVDPKIADPTEAPKPVAPKPAPTLETETAVQPWVASVHYSYLDMMLPSKFGVAIGRGLSETSMWELEYTHGSFTPFFIDDIGKFTEDRISLVQRSGSSTLSGFQWFYGVFYHRFKLAIGDALLKRLTTYYPSADVISISGLGGVIGVGYRWLVSERFLIGIDAITYSQPIINLTSDTRFLEVVTDPNDRSKVEAGLTVMKYFPRVGVAKIALGYTF